MEHSVHQFVRKCDLRDLNQNLHSIICYQTLYQQEKINISIYPKFNISELLGEVKAKKKSLPLIRKA